MQTDGGIIYVAGNPALYPLEYYDAETQTYLGAIPEFLSAFAQAYGYDLRYFQPGAADRRAELAENQQVNLISGCEAGEQYAHTAGEPLVLFSSQTEGQETGYILFLTDVSPAQFQADLRAYAAQTSQETWMGAVLRSADEAPPPQTHPELLWSVGLAALVCVIALLLFRRRGRKRRGAPPSPAEDGWDSLPALKAAFTGAASSPLRSGYSLICVHLDLDRMGQLWGYEQVRDFLLHGARTLREAAEPGDHLARRGEDLLVLKRAEDPQDAVRWAESVVQQIRGTFSASPLPGDAAAGIYPLTAAPQDFDRTLFHAGQCARTACRKGQASRLCGTEQCRFCQECRELLVDFSKALGREEFLLYIQFFVDADSYRIVGGEALSRWYHPKLGLLNPASYVPLLEETGQIAALDFYGLERACAFLESLSRHQVQDFFLSCNFARKTLCAPDFPQRCVQVIQRFAFPRKLLILEVTESQQMDRYEMEQLRQNILKIRESGMRVIFDDFGVGFSSFRDLQSCPMDGLKLDKELVDHMQTEKGRIILSALVEIGHRMGLTILAEGVEEPAQVTMLRDLHCDAFQGFQFAVPLPELDARRRILSGERTLNGQGRQHKE